MASKKKRDRLKEEIKDLKEDLRMKPFYESANAEQAKVIKELLPYKEECERLQAKQDQWIIDASEIDRLKEENRSLSKDLKEAVKKLNGVAGREMKKLIDGTTDYYITEDGRVFHRDFELKPNAFSRYLFCQFRVNGIKKNLPVHCLVAYHFIGPRPFPKAQIRHLDGNRRNNHVSNLAYGTAKQNFQDPTMRRPKFPLELVKKFRSEFLAGESLRKIAKRYDTGFRVVQSAIMGFSAKYYGLKIPDRFKRISPKSRRRLTSARRKIASMKEEYYRDKNHVQFQKSAIYKNLIPLK